MVRYMLFDICVNLWSYKKMGPIILVKMITHNTSNLTLYNGISQIHTAFSAPVNLRFYVPLDNIKLRR